MPFSCINREFLLPKEGGRRTAVVGREVVMPLFFSSYLTLYIDLIEEMIDVKNHSHLIENRSVGKLQILWKRMNEGGHLFVVYSFGIAATK